MKSREKGEVGINLNQLVYFIIFSLTVVCFNVNYTPNILPCLPGNNGSHRFGSSLGKESLLFCHIIFIEVEYSPNLLAGHYVLVGYSQDR